VSIAVIAATMAAGLLLVVALAATRERRRRSAGGPVARALHQLSSRLDAMSGELSTRSSPDAAHRAPSLPVVDLRGAHDLQALATRTLRAAHGFPGVDAAAIEIVAGGDPIVEAVGIPPDQAGLRRINGPPDGRRVAAVQTSYAYDQDDEPPGALRSGLAVTLAAHDQELGVIAVYSFDPAVPDHVVSAIDELARSIVPALDAARRRLEPTSLRGRSLHDRLTWEIASARRGHRLLALLLLAVHAEAVDERLGLLAADDAGAAAAWIRDIVRRSDTSFRLGGEEIAVILPDATRADAERLYGRLAALLGSEPSAGEAPPVSAGIAELEPDDDAMSLFQRADAELYDAKARSKGTAA
jgi:diguanylate cyclase (GGDEF)-like protein